MSDDVHEIKKEVKVYLTVFGALLFLTIVTVGVSYLKLSIAGAITLALIIATIKASLVACYFMHLISERKMIYSVLVLTVIFFVALISLPIWGTKDHLVGTEMLDIPSMTQKAEAHH